MKKKWAPEASRSAGSTAPTRASKALTPGPSPKGRGGERSAWNFLPSRLAAIPTRLGFVKPTPVQEECLPPALAGESLLAVAPTGTGKTLVYLLPLWSKLPASHRNLVLVPTRELGYQVSQMLQALDARAREGLVLALGGHDAQAQRRRLAGGWHTLIATPGRLIDLLAETPQLLRSVKLLVLDEFDRLIDMGFEEQLAAILPHVPARRQTLLFSATGEGDALDRLPLGTLKHYLARKEKSAPLEESLYYLKSNRKKNELLLEAIRATRGQVLVFVANREKANHLNGLLRHKGVSSQALHGDRLQSERALAYQGFRDGRFQVLVATDLAARGLDIPEVDLVVNFDPPRTFRDYVHRSGRTARRSRPGSCITFAGPDDYLALRNLEDANLEALRPIPGFDRRDAWFATAKRTHDAKVRLQKRAEFLRREQGIE